MHSRPEVDPVTQEGKSKMEGEIGNSASLRSLFMRGRSKSRPGWRET